MCVHHTKNYWRGLLRLEFEARVSVSGWIGKSSLDEGGNRPDQEGQQIGKDTYNKILSGSFVPSAANRMTEQEMVCIYVYVMKARPTMLKHLSSTTYVHAL